MKPQKFRKRLALLPLAALLGFALAGCESASQQIEELETTPAPIDDVQPSDAIRVIDSGFFWDGETLSYAFTAENQDEETSMEETIVQVSVYDDTGEAIASDSAMIDFILPGQVVAFAAHLPLKLEPTRIAYAFLVGNEATVVVASRFESTTGYFEETSYGGRTVAAILNPYDRDLRRLRVVAILRSEDGEILSGGNATLELLPAQSESAITVDILGDLPSIPDRVDVYTMFTTDTVFHLD